MPRTRDNLQQALESVNGIASQVKVDLSAKVQEAEKTISEATGAPQNGVHSAMNTVQSYVHEGQRIASEHKAQLQDAVKKAVNVAQEYVEDARKKADPYVESAKAKVDSAKASVESARHSAQSAVDNAKDQVTAVRTRVTEKTQPYVNNYQEFDVTKTAAFHVLIHLISSVLYVVWRLTQLIPFAKQALNFLQQKEADAVVVHSCSAMVQRVPVVGPRCMEVATIVVSNVYTGLNEQISQYNAASQRKKTA